MVPILAKNPRSAAGRERWCDMAFGKKDKGGKPAIATAEVDVAPEPEVVATELPVMEDAMTIPENAAAEGAEGPAGDDAEHAGHGVDMDLLSVFSATEAESADNVLLLELAGNVEIDDLLEDLQTVAAALGIVMRRFEYDDDLDDDALDELAA